MTVRKETGAPWHHTTIVLRPDIYRLALEQGIDISDACNRALAGLTGIEYHWQQQEDVPATPPVIIARDGSFPDAPVETKKGPVQKMPPVINADDPGAPARVVQAKIRPGKKAPAEPLPLIPSRDSAEEKPARMPAAGMKKTTVPKERITPKKKRSKEDALKTFFSTKISRTDDPKAAVSKDELYEIFSRFCREHRIAKVPEQRTVTVALKNQFALSEKLVNGTPHWTGIRLK